LQGKRFVYHSHQIEAVHIFPVINLVIELYGPWAGSDSQVLQNRFRRTNLRSTILYLDYENPVLPAFALEQELGQ
jgi:hypothetical protein